MQKRIDKGLFQLIYIKKYPVKILSDKCKHKNPFNLYKKIFFTLYKGEIIVSESLEELAFNDNFQLCKRALSFYSSTGLIIPPYTVFKKIYCIPIGFKYSQTLNDYVIERKQYCKDNNTIEILGETIVSNFKFEKVNLLLSGGADSSLLLYLIKKYNPTCKIKSLFFNSGNIKNDLERARNLSSILKTELHEIVPIISDASEVEKLITEHSLSLKEPIYETMLFTMHSIFKEIPDGSIVFDGQGADTVLGGLPHHLLVQIYKNKFIRIAVKIKLIDIIKNIIKPFRNKSRILYRFFKILSSIREENISSCLINSLYSNNEILKKDRMFKIYESIIKIYLAEYDEISSVSLFFLSILSSRELQKYTLNNKLVYCLPFLEEKFIHYCLSIPGNFKCTLNRRKIPIIDYLNRNLPLKFFASQQLPFEPHISHVLSRKDEKSFDPLVKSKRIREISIKSLAKQYKY